jgi:hypothetical protein
MHALAMDILSLYYSTVKALKYVRQLEHLKIIANEIRAV